MAVRMILFMTAVFAILAALLAYPIIKIRISPSISRPAPSPLRSGAAIDLYRHVETLSVKIGSRSVFEYAQIDAAKEYIETVLRDSGIPYSLQTYSFEGKTYSNVIVTIAGKIRSAEVVIFGAHYDSVLGTPGADDNASGVSILLEMCRALRSFSPGRTLKLVFFALEEHPIFHTENMGSYVYAAWARESTEDIRAMVALEMLGYYSDVKGAQSFPLPFMSLIYSSTPDFVAVVGNPKSKDIVKRIRDSIRKVPGLPVETLAASGMVPGVDLSDHAPFWDMGYPAVMITDTAFYRNPNYHSPSDTIETLDFEKMSLLLKGLIQTARDLADG
ncbi:MAG: M20/M25/M40 family metallo-hydrolase [Syntrophales bacterium]